MASCSVLSTYCTASPSTPGRARGPRGWPATSALLDSSASLPPRRIAALPDFRHSAAASTVTFGRDS